MIFFHNKCISRLNIHSNLLHKSYALYIINYFFRLSNNLRHVFSNYKEKILLIFCTLFYFGVFVDYFSNLLYNYCEHKIIVNVKINLTFTIIILLILPCTSVPCGHSVHIGTGERKNIFFVHYNSYINCNI